MVLHLLLHPSQRHQGQRLHGSGDVRLQTGEYIQITRHAAVMLEPARLTKRTWHPCRGVGGRWGEGEGAGFKPRKGAISLRL